MSSAPGSYSCAAAPAPQRTHLDERKDGALRGRPTRAFTVPLRDPALLELRAVVLDSLELAIAVRQDFRRRVARLLFPPRAALEVVHVRAPPESLNVVQARSGAAGFESRSALCSRAARVRRKYVRGSESNCEHDSRKI